MRTNWKLIPIPKPARIWKPINLGLAVKRLVVERRPKPTAEMGGLRSALVARMTYPMRIMW